MNPPDKTTRHKPVSTGLPTCPGHGFSINVAQGAELTGCHQAMRNTSHAHWLELYPALAVSVVERTHAAHRRRRLRVPARERVMWSSGRQ